MFNLFKRKPAYTIKKRGYLVVTTLYNFTPESRRDTTQPSPGSINYVFDKEDGEFKRKKMLIPNFSKAFMFDSVDDAIKTVSGNRKYKRFLAGTNVTSICYVEMYPVKSSQKNNSVDELYSDVNVISLYYVPSRLSLEKTD